MGDLVDGVVSPFVTGLATPQMANNIIVGCKGFHFQNPKRTRKIISNTGIFDKEVGQTK